MLKCNMENYTDTISFIKSLYPKKDFIPLHEPLFIGNERKYILDAIDSTFVSSVGEYVNRFEKMMAETAGTKYAIATVNGTAALHIALILAEVKQTDEVITQALTFIATANAISYIGARPVFIDVDKETLGMSPNNLKNFLNEFGERKKDGFTYNKLTGKRIKACVPMHTFGFPCKIDELVDICNIWNITLIEDAAESIGSYYKGKRTGSFGLMGTFSFNGNKTITCGGGGALITNNEAIAKLAKHLTTQAKVPHAWEFNHDHIGYNYRMPNLNAAMACAQLEQLNSFINNKRQIAKRYDTFFENNRQIKFVNEPVNSKSNYWLNCILLNNKTDRDVFLKATNEHGVMTRPAWTLMNKLTIFNDCQHDGLKNSEFIEDRLVNIPSSVIV
jgi:perosamine synthetase